MSKVFKHTAKEILSFGWDSHEKDDAADAARYATFILGDWRGNMKDEFYYTTENLKGLAAELGDIVYIRHMYDPGRSGFYQKVAIGSEAFYLSITCGHVSKVSAYPVEVGPHDYVITHLIKGLNIQSFYLHLQDANSRDVAVTLATVNSVGIHMTDLVSRNLKNTLENEVKVIDDELTTIDRELKEAWAKARELQSKKAVKEVQKDQAIRNLENIKK